MVRKLSCAHRERSSKHFLIRAEILVHEDYWQGQQLRNQSDNIYRIVADHAQTVEQHDVLIGCSSEGMHNDARLEGYHRNQRPKVGNVVEEER